MKVGEVANEGAARYGKPLDGVRVLAAEQMQALPYATQLLARLGADIVKVEPLAGESGRGAEPSMLDPDGRVVGATFLRNNLGKRSIALDLKSDRGRDLFLQLVPRFDVVAENFKAGTMDRFGLGYDRLSATHPAVIFLSISGFGASGSPYSSWPAYAPIVEAMSGIYEYLNPATQPPKAAPVGALGDISVALFATIGVLAALRHRDATGEGQQVDIAMFDTAVAMTDIVMNLASLGQPKQPFPKHFILDTFRAADGWFVMQIVREHQFGPLAEVIGRPEWINDPRLATRQSWGEHLEDIIRPGVEAWASTRSMVEASKELTAAGVAAGPCFHSSDVISDPHLERRHMIVEMDRVDGGDEPVLIPGNPVKLSKVAEGPETRVPWVGEHTADVLRSELGLSDGELADLAGRPASSQRRERAERAHADRATAREPVGDGARPKGAGAQPPGVVVSDGAITDEGIARLRARIGIVEPHPQPPHYLQAGTDAFRHVAVAYGDDNPLWCDPSYGAKTRWQGPIAPPPLVGGDTLIGEDEVTELDADTRQLLKGDPLRGVHAFYATSAREWWAPLTPDRRVFRRNALVGVLDKPSEFAERAVHEWTAQVFRDDLGAVLSAQFRNMIRTERTKAREKKKYDDVTVAPYTDDEIDAIDAQYAAESRRGAEPRWFEDVHEGDEIGPMVKGPLTVTDILCWHVGMGMGLYGVQPLRLGYENRRRIPRFFHRDELNVPDVMQRVHWDPEFARRSGNPTTFDYGRMRETWLIHLCTDWMGDDAWLWKLDCEFRKFNYVGDTQFLRGVVTRSYLAEGDRPAIDVDLFAKNQRGELTTPGHASIFLPSRAHGPVRLPDPPGGATDLQAALDAIAGRFDRS